VTRVHSPHEAPLGAFIIKPATSRLLHPTLHVAHILLQPARWLNQLCRRSTGIPPCCMYCVLRVQMQHRTDKTIAGGFCFPSRWSWYAVLSSPCWNID
jgi:hypothetical protein